MLWEQSETYLIGKYNYEQKAKSVGFDLDHTLIKPVKGRFSKSHDDWIFYADTVVDKLQGLHGNKYGIIIISNQSGLKNISKLQVWKRKIALFAKKLNLPFMILVAIDYDQYRKPCIGFKHFMGELTFYCGDAGGADNDFSDTDYKFAKNLEITFHHPRTYFLKEKVINCSINYISFQDIKKGKYKFNSNESQELIINVGFAGSGKSYYTKKHILPMGYKHVNQDTLKTTNKCLKMAQKYLEQGHSVVIDNTNPTKEIRQRYIKLALSEKLSNGIEIRCFHFTTSMELSRHNNHYRSCVNNIKAVPLIAYRIYNKKFAKPTMDEGYNAIKQINFLLNEDEIADMSAYEKYYY